MCPNLPMLYVNLQVSQQIGPVIDQPWVAPIVVSRGRGLGTRIGSNGQEWPQPGCALMGPSSVQLKNSTIWKDESESHAFQAQLNLKDIVRRSSRGSHALTSSQACICLHSRIELSCLSATIYLARLKSSEVSRSRCMPEYRM